MRKRNVLIADANVKLGEESRKLLSSMDEVHIIDVVRSGKEVLNVLKEKNVDILLTDTYLHGIDGCGIISIIKQSPDINHKPFCIVSSCVYNDIIINNAYDMGADYYLLKPYSELMFKQVLQLAKTKAVNNKILYDKDQIFYDTTKMLKDFGLSSKFKGYNYLRNAICACIEDPKILEGVTKILYPDLDENGSGSCAERVMRYAIEIIFTKGDIELIEKVFGRRNENFDKPSVTEFIACVADYIMMNYKK